MKKHIPNAITLLNLVCGTLACILALRNRPMAAFYLIVGAAVADFFDGLAARLLHSESETGRELDSLCDLVSFGLAPSFMVFRRAIIASTIHTRWMLFTIFAVTLIYVCCAALRLARYNSTPGRADHNFTGLPVPAAAMLVAATTACSTVAADGHVFAPFMGFLNNSWTLLAVELAAAPLMVSRLVHFSLKGKKLSFRQCPAVCLHLLATIVLIPVLAVLCTGKGGFWANRLALLPFSALICFVLYEVINLASRKK